MKKEKLIKQEKERLNKIFENMSGDRKSTISSLIDKAAFMSVTLEELQGIINKSGVVSEYQNGANQWGTKKSPEVEVYNTMIKNYSSIIKQLSDLLPKETVEEEPDEFDEFVLNKKNI
jgi:hypothetical protein